MKKILTTLVLGCCLISAKAQDMPHQHWKSLNLTPEQQNKMADLRKEHQEKMTAILTPEQRRQFDQQKLEMKAKKAEHAAARMEKITKKLQLSPDQSANMTRLNQDFRSKAALIRANQELAAAEQRNQLKALAESHHADVTAMLDPSQQAMLEELKAKRHKPVSR